jgi:hypothetical protein
VIRSEISLVAILWCPTYLLTIIAVRCGLLSYVFMMGIPKRFVSYM